MKKKMKNEIKGKKGAMKDTMPKNGAKDKEARMKRLEGKKIG